MDRITLLLSGHSMQTKFDDVIGAKAGHVAILGFDACFPDSAVGFVPAKSVDTVYLYFLFHALKAELDRDSITGKLDVRDFARTLPADIAEEAAELAKSELGDDEFSESYDELADELAGEPA